MDTNPALALINDALQRLGKVRLSLDLAKDLMQKSESELNAAGDKIASAAIGLREIAAKL